MRRSRLNPVRRQTVAFARPWWARLRERCGQVLARTIRLLRGRATPPPAEAAHRRVGRRGEECARAFLERQGYRIIAANLRQQFAGRRWAEMDLIAWQGRTLVFVEVKTRTRRQPGFAAEQAVHRGKRRRLIAGAKNYLRLRGWRCAYRFDVVSVYGPDQPRPEVELLRDAFH